MQTLAHADRPARPAAAAPVRLAPRAAIRRLLADAPAPVVQQRLARPQLQRLTITPLSCVKRACGEYNASWRFALDRPAPEKGYLVQQIDRSELIGTCSDAGPVAGPPAPVQTYWEAWPVGRRKRMDRLTREDGYTDESTWPATPATSGTQIAAGTVKFFTFSTTGDLGNFDQAPADPTSPWDVGTVPGSGSLLPATASKPPWWDDPPVEGPATREAASRWDCCNYIPALQTSETTIKPDTPHVPCEE